MARTPYRRVLASPMIDEEIKIKLEKQYDMLNPARLKIEITKLQNELLRLNVLNQKIDKENKKKRSLSFIFLLEVAYQLSSTFLGDQQGD